MLLLLDQLTKNKLLVIFVDLKFKKSYNFLLKSEI